tara:strand:+ start:1285 stop:1809 length:525 start_codon:yes stop_codon:yes gene_type:complete
MSKRVKINISGSLGADLTTLSIYHTLVTGSNLLTASITASALTDGIFFDVEDSIFTFIARSDNGTCLHTTGSIVVANAGNTRYFTVVSDGEGSVQVNSPVTVAATSSSIAQEVNFNVHSLFVIEASSTYPKVFDGWYHVPSGSQASPTQISSTNILSIEAETFTTSDNFYAYFS